MRRGRIGVAVVLLVLAVAAALLAADIRSWQSAIQTGDLRFSQEPGYAQWSAKTTLPGNPALRLLGLRSQLTFRKTAQQFVSAEAAGEGFDNGYSEARQRGAVESVLTTLAAGPDRKRDSAADNMLGILAFTDSKSSGPYAPTPVERSVSDFRSAVQLDPADEAAKFNLEWLLLELLPKGSRPGSGGSAGAAKTGHHGAGGGVPGKGY